MEEQLKAAMAAALQVQPERIQPGCGPHTIPSWDSAAHMRLVLELEQRFQIRFNDDEVAELAGYEAILSALHRLTGRT
jgi:acyl carrier protein